MTPPVEELLCFGIVALFLATAGRRDFARFALLALSAWITEESCIRLYGFYGYSEGWHLVLGAVPLAVVIVWPVVILSATALARALAPSQVALACAGLVFADAALIEPVAVRSGLWRWTEPGLFEVPPVGVLGWALFTLLAVAWFERDREPCLRRDTLVVVLAPIACHLLLLASWWGALRWIGGAIPSEAGVVAVWTAAAFFSYRAARRPGVSRGLLLARLPGFMFFVGILAVRGRDDPWLIAYVAGFTAPYLVLLAKGHDRQPDPERPQLGASASDRPTEGLTR